MSDCGQSRPTGNPPGDGPMEQQNAPNSGREPSQSSSIDYSTERERCSTQEIRVQMNSKKEIWPLTVPVDIGRLRDEDVLKDDNWRAWKIRILHLLSINDLDKYPLSLVKKPSRPDENDTWHMLDQAAAHIIIDNVSSSQFGLVPGLFWTDGQRPLSSAQIWEGLCQQYEPPVSPRTSVIELRRLYTARADEQSDISKYLLDMQALRFRLLTADHHLRDDEYFNSLLITSLPESWHNYAMSVFGIPGTPRWEQNPATTVQLISSLISEGRRRTACEKERRDESYRAKVSLQNKRKRDAEPCAICGKANHTTDGCRWKQKGGYCTRCQHGGHWTRNCQGKDKGKQRAGDSGMVVHAAGAPTDAGTSGSGSKQCAQSNHINCRWVATTSVSHIANDRRIFVTYTEETTKLQALGNQVITAVGRGTVILASKVGDNTYKMKLHNTLHVPTAEENLFSLGRFADGGGRFVAEDDVASFYAKGGALIAVGRPGGKDKLFCFDVQAKADPALITEGREGGERATEVASSNDDDDFQEVCLSVFRILD